jgi:Iap family predicted aminopeptidase
MRAVSPAEVREHLNVLTHDIGVRLAGSSGERQAADYVASRLARCGATVTVESFPVRERAVTSETLEFLVGSEWHHVACSLLSNTPGTGGRPLEAPVAVIDAATGYQREDLSGLTGRAVIHLGSHIESAEHYRRLMAARPAFLLFVDTRYPGGVVTADGMFPAYVHAFGAVPTVSVAYQDAWNAYAAGISAARVCVAGGMRDSTSQNVVGELTGGDPSAGVIYMGAHHDTQAGSVGADDNGTGVAAILALAAALADRPRRRTIRLISFGAEEQLSVGSATYVRRHRTELSAHGRFMFNFDAFGSLLGWTFLVCNGPGEIGPYFVRHFAAADIIVKPDSALIPYSDHFPFVAAGVPAAWIGRNNCAAGRFFHHRPDDDLTRVSCPLVAAVVSAAGTGLAELAACDDLPFPAGADAATSQAAARMWDELFGGWDGFTAA